MSKKVIGLMVQVLSLIFIIGCSTSGVKVRSYIDDRAREDQEIDGNAGYLVGKPSEEEIVRGKPTRKVFVLEISKEAPKDASTEYLLVEEPKKDTSISPSLLKEPVQKKNVVQQKKKVELPSFDDDDFEAEDDKIASIDKSSFTTYVVQKDDTLQKISKKFYNSFSKWTKIYEANKEKIKNPDNIMPGITLNIPIE